jgi:ketosteroid isomerase-like protein
LRFFSRIPVAVLALSLAIPTIAQQKPLTSDQQHVVDTVKSIFVAAKADDFAKFNSIVIPGYYMFDGGMRFDGDAIMRLIRDDHAKGIRYEWNVTDPDVHIHGNIAWIAYVNRGSITDPQGKVMKMNWLESAFLEKQGGVWKIAFFHSTRVAAPQAPK